MHHVQQHVQAKPVRLVYERLQRHSPSVTVSASHVHACTSVPQSCPIFENKGSGPSLEIDRLVVRKQQIETGRAVRQQHLQLFWVARPGRNGIGRGDMIPEGCIVCMLLHCHELDGVVSQLVYPRQHVVCAVAASNVRIACMVHMGNAEPGVRGGLPLKYVYDATAGSSELMPTCAS